MPIFIVMCTNILQLLTLLMIWFLREYFTKNKFFNGQFCTFSKVNFFTLSLRAGVKKPNFYGHVRKGGGGSTPVRKMKS